MGLFGRSNFIEIYDNALSKKECDILIDQFEKSDPQQGGIGTFETYRTENDIKKCLQSAYQISDGSVVSLIVRNSLFDCIDKYKEKYKILNITPHRWECDDYYNFQKYEDQTDGFKAWHTEHGNTPITSKRIMVWMFYLNNAKSGTDFYNHPNVLAKKGRCVIWPAGWEYYHRSTPNKGLKYIVTGWISYLESLSK